MRQILFIQGGGKDVHDSWDNKLVESLRRELGAGYEVRYPRMPNEDDPKYSAWKPAIEAEIAKLESGAIIVGHSLGATIMVNSLAESTPPIRLGAIVLIAAPFIGDGGWDAVRRAHRAADRARLGEVRAIVGDQGKAPVWRARTSTATSRRSSFS
jgi:predicted alpha/beta hydrolase family esterase